MIQKSNQFLLEESLSLLVRHFGFDQVQRTLLKVSDSAVERTKDKNPRASSKRNQQTNPSITNTLEKLRQEDDEKYRLLLDFYLQLKDRKILPESQDIRQFAQIVGLKEIRGKSRQDLIPQLMRFLVEQPKDRLQVDVKRAATVSEAERQQGFSVLTDKLLGDK